MMTPDSKMQATTGRDVFDVQGAVQGRCLCGAIRFALQAPLRKVLICHCCQCSRWTGYAVAATAVPAMNFELHAGHEYLSWFQSSERAERGFCSRCGSSLFWRRKNSDEISILAGTLEPPTHLTVAAHIYVEYKPDFYALTDQLPQYRGSFTKHGKNSRPSSE